MKCPYCLKTIKGERNELTMQRRRQKILQYAEEKTMVNANSIFKILRLKGFSVNRRTVSRDIEFLENQGYISIVKENLDRGGFRNIVVFEKKPEVQLWNKR